MTNAQDRSPPGGDLLAEWEVVGTGAGTVEGPEGLPKEPSSWLSARVPGTVAGAFRDADRRLHYEELDERDWWFHATIEGRAGRWALELGGVATLCDVWLNGEHLLHSENMHRAHRALVELPTASNDLVVRCGALAPVLAQKRPRPRWKTYLVDHQNLRWVRTSLLGRIPGWAVAPPAVGLWRPASLAAVADATPVGVRLRATPDGSGGIVTAAFELPGMERIARAELRVGDRSAPLDVVQTAGGLELYGEVRLPRIERWWPHTHGPQPLYDVVADLGGRSRSLGRVGFRTVAVERSGGAFEVAVNDEPVFCRGACWLPVDPVAIACPDDALEARLRLARAGNMNMLRVPGTTVYEDRRFFDLCDELGVLVWHDCMFAFCDPPTEESFVEEVVAEVDEACAAMSGHPSVVVVCGNQEVEEVAAMNGLESSQMATPLFEETIARVVNDVLPDVAYVVSNPTGGNLPFRMDQGVSQYFGVGGYFQEPKDVRRDGVRFAAECMAFATPPEPETIEEACGGAYRAGHDPEWKAGVHHDSRRSWDMEDVRDHYVRTVFGVDPLTERQVDPERALEIGRAVHAHLMESVMSEWRRPMSTCAGGLVLALCDLRPGAGWGVVDALGRPKAPWYTLRRVFQPVVLLAVDEGLNGLKLHVVNDTGRAVRGKISVELVSGGEHVVERGETAVEAGARGSWSSDAETVLGGFRDVTYAYRFAPPAHDAVIARLWSEAGDVVSEVVHLPLGQNRPFEQDLGLAAVARRRGTGDWTLDVSSVRLAQWVTVRVRGFDVEDSWFHLPPGGSRRVALRSRRGDARPQGAVHALNARRGAAVVVES